MNKMRGRLAPVIIGVVTSMAACQTTPGTPGYSSPASPATVSPDTETRPATPSSPLDDLGDPTHAPGGKVTVSLSATRYSAGAPIVVVVINGLDRPIFTDDSKADCSIITLQRQDRATWKNIVGCAQQRPPATVAIGPAHARTITLQPASVNFDTLNNTQGPLASGTYRAQYTYRFDADAGGPDKFAAVSDSFEIK